MLDASKGVPTDNNIKANTLAITNTVIAGCAKPVDYSASSTPTGWTVADVTAWFTTPAHGNTILATNDEVKLTFVVVAKK